VASGDRRTFVQPGATETVRTAAGRYRFESARSVLVLRKPCSQTFEGALREIDCILARE